MCKAIDEMVNIGRMEGRKIGLAEGRQEGILAGRQEGIQEGIRKGIREGRSRVLAKLYAEKVISLEKACAEAKMTKEEFLKYSKMN